MTQIDAQVARPEALRIGVAILYVADSRALDATLKSIARSRTAPARLLVVEQPLLTRPLAAVELPAGADIHSAPPWIAAQAAALERLDDCDLVILLREGVVVAPAALGNEADRFAGDEDLAGALTVSRLHLDMATFKDMGAENDPYAAVIRANRRRPSFAPRYFSPCMLTLAPKRIGAGSFERFAKRSGWAAARFYLSSLPAGTKTIEASSNAIGLIGDVPDRRESRRQGFDAVEELYRFKSSFPQDGAFVAAEIRRVFLEQLYGMAVTRHVKARAKFLLGALGAIQAQRKVSARLRRDIASLG